MKSWSKKLWENMENNWYSRWQKRNVPFSLTVETLTGIYMILEKGDSSFGLIMGILVLASVALRMKETLDEQKEQ